MNGLPTNADVSVLRRRTLEQVCVGRFHLALRFDGDVSIDIESPLTLGGSDVGPGRYESLLTLLGDEVLDATVSESGGLVLKWKGHESLLVIDVAAGYESFTVSAPGVFLVA